MYEIKVHNIEYILEYITDYVATFDYPLRTHVVAAKSNALRDRSIFHKRVHLL